jgi:hypothetical protein
MGGACSTQRRTEGKTPLGIPRHRSEDNIRMNLRKMEWKGEEWTHLAQGKEQRQVLVNTVMNTEVP